MKRSIAVSALMLGLSGPALAADLYNNGTVPSALQSGATSFTTAIVSGAYVSVGVGGALDSAHVPQAASDFSLSGFDGDLRVGYDYKLPNYPWVAGVFVGLGVEDVGGQGAGVNLQQVLGYEAGLRFGRIVNGDALIYGLVAYHGQHIGLDNTGFSADQQGLELGGGLEIDMKNGVTLGGEVDYTLYRDWSAGGASIGENELAAKVRLGVRPAAFVPIN